MISLTFWGTFLLFSLNKYVRKNNLNVLIGFERASTIDEEGKEADIILLAPNFYAKEAEVKGEFPNKLVKVIDRQDYGLLKAENILKMALSEEGKQNRCVVSGGSICFLFLY